MRGTFFAAGVYESCLGILYDRALCELALAALSSYVCSCVVLILCAQKVNIKIYEHFQFLTGLYIEEAFGIVANTGSLTLKLSHENQLLHKHNHTIDWYAACMLVLSLLLHRNKLKVCRKRIMNSR